MSDWTPSRGFDPGDIVEADIRPPLTWWDLLLWRLFRYERKRPSRRGILVCTEVHTSHVAPVMLERLD